MGYAESLKEKSGLPEDLKLTLTRLEDAKTLEITLASENNNQVQAYLQQVCKEIEKDIASSVTDALQEIRAYAQTGMEQNQEALEFYTQEVDTLLAQYKGADMSFSLYNQLQQTLKNYTQALVDQNAFQSLLVRCDSLENAGVSPRVQVKDTQQTSFSQMNRFAAYMIITFLGAVVISIIVTLAYNTLRRAYQEGK